ncbi:zinc finger protein OZF-like [Anopheles gambiae]|uniref:zinc finger protein OZF-like n=1 Tax=Anopheles gambiae TaxID=7165 RepID=UPI002AC8F0B9|nr:zinc finger protein OZF-like [Anopheles gambiae]
MLQQFLCRVCATSDAACVLMDIFEKHGAEHSVADILLELASVVVTVDDGFPQQCCMQCHADLVQAVSVRRKCIETEQLFRIKIEPNACHADDAYDDTQADNASIAPSDDGDDSNDKNPFYHCCECATDFSDSDTLREHYESKHANTIYGWQSFGISEISLFDSTDDEHEAKGEILYRPLNVPPQNNPPYKCCGCKAVFVTVDQLHQHSTVHARNAEEFDEDKPYQCDVCYRAFVSKLRVREHQMGRWFERYQCAVCGMMFGRLNQCNAHERNHTARKVNCVACGKEFNNSKNLYRHEQIVHVDPNSRKKYICNVCGAKVLSSSYLKVHMRLHSKENPYSCNLCGARFKVARYLKWHLRKHKELYPCKQCGLSFQSYSLLQDHMKTHFVGRKYSCSFCPKFFCQKPGLINHLNKVHKSE